MKKNNKKKIKILAIIPARSGSKGIKDKNIKNLKGKPLLAWSIDTCKKSKKIDYFFVLTDSKKYKRIAEKYGADVPLDRPKSISGDNSSDIDFIKYSLDKLEKLNINPILIVNIRPTTPFRDYRLIDKAISFFLKNKNRYSSLRSVEEMPETALKTLFIKKNLATPIIKGFSMDKIGSPRQNFKKTFSANGYIDIYKTDIIKKNNSLYGKKVFAYLTNRTIEIDCIYDLKLARKFYG